LLTFEEGGMNKNSWYLYTVEHLKIVRSYYLETGNPVVDVERVVRLRTFQRIANEYVMYKFGLEESVSYEGGFEIGSYEIKNKLFNVGLEVDHRLILREWERATDYPLWRKVLHWTGLVIRKAPAKSYVPSEDYKRVFSVISTWKNFMDAVLEEGWESVQLENREEVSAFLRRVLTPEIFDVEEFDDFLEYSRRNHFSVLSCV